MGATESSSKGGGKKTPRSHCLGGDLQKHGGFLSHRATTKIIYVGFSLKNNHPAIYWGTPIYGNPRICDHSEGWDMSNAAFKGPKENGFNAFGTLKWLHGCFIEVAVCLNLVPL